jgi:TRAP transporter 4TM/12TM fusion protein
VATTGPISIPIMKRVGLPAYKAGGIEAAASTGGSILPPVMGAVAFIMADFTGIPYHLICLYAVIPALIYYACIFAQVHFEAELFGYGQLPEDQIVGLGVALRRNWPSLLPVGSLMWLLISGYSAAYVAAGSAVAVIVASWLGRRNAIGPQRFVAACVETCQSMAPLVGAVAAAGLIIGCIEMTGLSGKFTLLLFQLSGGLLVPTLVLSAVILVLLGMGMPTTGVYIMGVALLAPVLISKFGILIMQAHMFVLFFSCMSAITPPVAVAAFAAGSIAATNPFRVGWYACRLAIAGFIVPFFFVFNPGVLMQGGAVEVAGHTLFGLVGCLLCVLMLHGYVRRSRIALPLRALLAVASIALIYPMWELQAAVAAAAVTVVVLLRRRAAQAAPSPSAA